VAYYDELAVAARRAQTIPGADSQDRSTTASSIYLIQSHLSYAILFAINGVRPPRVGETPARANAKLGRVKVKTVLAVRWTASEIEPVPVLYATGLKIRAADRRVQFVRSHRPNYARYSAANEPRRGKPVLVF